MSWKLENFIKQWGPCIPLFGIDFKMIPTSVPETVKKSLEKQTDKKGNLIRAPFFPFEVRALKSMKIS